MRTISAALLCTAAGCTVLLDKTATQCTTNADCEHFSGHPLCEEGVCVASGLGPEGCVVDPPKTQLDFLNACSTSKCVAFDNCDRLGLCSPSMALPATQDPVNQSIPPLVNPVTAPMNLCTDGAPGGRVIWLFGSADFGPLLHAAQPSLSHPANGGNAYRAVFQGNTSCAGVNSVFDSTKRIMRDPPTETQGGWAFYFDDNGQQVNCRIDPFGTMPPTPGVLVDIGISNLYSQTCNPTLVPGTTVAEYTGPVTPFVLSVPSTSSETAISVEAAHFVFGLGGKAPTGSGMKDAAPWTDPTNYSIRNSNSGSTVLTALLVDVPRTKFWGVDRLSTENLRDSLLASTSTNASIGILSIDFNDKNRGNLKALYLQSKGQKCGYLPDSGPSTYDKLNVRDGHYPLWGYVHFFTPLQAGNVPSPAANAMVLLFRVQKIEQRLLDDIIAASLTPQCAMKVERASEVGDFTPRTGLSCGCYFDFKTKNHTDCQVCTGSEECPSQTECNYGYCEPTGT
ncbi:MAG TPA: hypothetical protein VFK02_12550 [Kofleriaceae bacterium]|nr:hypothetical protein [Kofleriaceae bacterium]